MVSWDSCVPMVRSRWWVMSRTVIPPAYGEMIMSPRPPAGRGHRGSGNRRADTADEWRGRWLTPRPTPRTWRDEAGPVEDGRAARARPRITAADELKQSLDGADELQRLSCWRGSRNYAQAHGGKHRVRVGHRLCSMGNSLGRQPTRLRTISDPARTPPSHPGLCEPSHPISHEPSSVKYPNHGTLWPRCPSVTSPGERGRHAKPSRTPGATACGGSCVYRRWPARRRDPRRHRSGDRLAASRDRTA
jgi:hypothetical protein